MNIYNEYIEVIKGNIPIIFSVVHGGIKDCQEIPERKEGIKGIDKGTIRLTLDLIKKIKNELNKKRSNLPILEPSCVIAKIRRSKIDLNRSKIHAFEKGSILAEKIYDFFHNTIKSIINSNIEKYGHSLLIDIHGFEKNKRPPGFREVDLILGTKNLKSLFNKPVLKRDWDKNIRGKIIKKCLEEGISIAPGHPRRKEYVLTGGYITEAYGATYLANSQALQIEFSDDIRINNKNLRKKVITIISEAICEYLINY
ncbi:MAG: hypothetical protein ACTSVV_18705 [Promethearchaeota archaeon]